MNGATSRVLAFAFIARNVSVAVRPRCAVQMTVVPGCVKQRANAIQPTSYVLRTCRHNDRAQILHAYNPDESFDRISRPRSSCHSSNNQPRLLHVSRTLGQPV